VVRGSSPCGPTNKNKPFGDNLKGFFVLGRVLD